MKLLAKIHAPPEAGWQTWFSSQYGWAGVRDLGDAGRLDTPTWKSLLALLPLFRESTACVVGNGEHTAFWCDLWLGETTLELRFPALFSHSVRPNTCVAVALQGLDAQLRPRLSSAACSELARLKEELRGVTLHHGMQDVRSLRVSGAVFTARGAYRAAMAVHEPDNFAPTIWRSFAPGKCKFFFWLCHRRCLPCRRHIIDGAACAFCGQDETLEHLLFGCAHASAIWALVAPGTAATQSVEGLFYASNAGLPGVPRMRFTVCIAIL